MAVVYSILAFLIGLLVGWLVWGRRPSIPDETAAPAAVSVTEPVTEAEPASSPVSPASPVKEEPTADLSEHISYAAVEDEPAPRPNPPVDVVEPAPVARPNPPVEAVEDEPEPEPEPAPVARPHLSAGVVEDESVAAPEPHVSADAVEPEPVAEARPQVDAGVVEPEPVVTPRPHVDPGAVEDEPAPRPHFSGGLTETAPPTDETVPIALVEPEQVVTPEPVAEPDPAPTMVIPASVAVPAQRVGAADDLKRVEGIGPKMAAALNAAGISTFTDLAETDEVALRAAISKAGMRFSPTLVTWPRQARLLADGDEAGFLELARSLKAGRVS